MKSVAFIGTGLMGKPMASSVLRKGFPTIVYNRTRRKVVELESAGARVAETARQAAEEADVVITMLSDIEAVDSVLSGDHGLMRAFAPGKIYIDMSTITPEASRKFAELVESTGARMLDAPVVGTNSVAEKAELTILVGGDPRVLEEVREVFQSMGKYIFHIGDHGSACGMKLVVNHFISGMIGLLAEGLELSEKLGIDPSVFSNVLNTSAVRSPVYELRAPKMMTRDHETQFPVRLLIKDLNYITQTAEKTGAVMPIHSLVRNLFTMAGAYGYGEKDISAIFELFDGKQLMGA